jgi:uncharacterized protein (UPF0218 family)
LEDVDFLQRLRRLIGRDCEYLGKRCRLIEVLGDEDILVLETLERVPPIQTDQYGQPAYRGNEVVHIPIYGHDPEQFSDDLLEVLACLKECSGERDH